VLKRLSVVVAIAALLVLAAGAIAGNFLFVSHHWPNSLRWGIAASSVAALLWLVFRTTDITQPEGTGRPQPLPPTNDEIALAYYTAAKVYDAEALRLFVKMMVDRPHYLERINESVTLEEETPELQVVTRQLFRVATPPPPYANNPSGFTIRDTGREPSQPPMGDHPIARLRKQGVSILVPLIWVEKGTLLDGFKVTDSSNNEVPTLSYNQARGLTVHLIETIINMAEPAPANNQTDDERKKEEARVLAIKANLVKAVCSPRRMKNKPRSQRTRVESLLNSTAELPVTPEWQSRIRDFCTELVDYYVIVAEIPVPSSDHVLLTYSQQIPVDSSAKGGINRIRSRVGLRYSAIDIPVNIFALDVEAYHMEMQASPMQYVFDHHLERLHSKHRLTQADLRRGSDKPYLRLHYNSAEPVAHLYIRRQSDRDTNGRMPAPAERGWTTNRSRRPTERLKAVVEFREIPAGTLGASAIISVMTAAIIAFFTITQIGQLRTQGNGPIVISSDVPALIIALPGFASVIIGSWLDLSHVRRASLSAYMGLCASVIFSLVSALYFLLVANKPVPGEITLSIATGIVIKTNIGWLVLAGLAITSSLFLVRDVISNSRYYSIQVKERVKRRT
jgi:hypothetical protein